MNYLSKTLIVVFLLFASVANASNNSFVGIIGAAIGDIKNQKDEKLANGWRKIKKPKYIISNSKSNAQILFLDQTVLTLGEETELTIDEFVYDPNSQDGSFVSTVKTGTVKFITGQISKNPDNLEVKVPAGTLGARGTEFVVLSESNNESTVVLLGPGPNNTLGMIPGNLILSDGVNSVDITNPGFEAMVKN